MGIGIVCVPATTVNKQLATELHYSSRKIQINLLIYSLTLFTSHTILLNIIHLHQPVKPLRELGKGLVSSKVAPSYSVTMASL